MQAVGRLGLNHVLRATMSADPGVQGTIRAATTGARLSNLINNLPSYVAAEAAVPVANHTQLLGLLLGTDIGPVVVPWASPATLLWYERGTRRHTPATGLGRRGHRPHHRPAVRNRPGHHPGHLVVLC
jgi:arsenical pump membrane protein